VVLARVHHLPTSILRFSTLSQLPLINMCPTVVAFYFFLGKATTLSNTSSNISNVCIISKGVHSFFHFHFHFFFFFGYLFDVLLFWEMHSWDAWDWRGSEMHLCHFGSHFTDLCAPHANKCLHKFKSDISSKQMQLMRFSYEKQLINIPLDNLMQCLTHYLILFLFVVGTS